jgi:hypothetical protein
MKKMKLTLGLLLATFAVACCQADHTFNVPVIANQGVKFPDGIIQTVAFTGTGSAVTWATLSGKPNFAAIATSGLFSDLLSKPITLAGYGITDAALATHNHNTLYKAIGYVPAWAEITGKPTFSLVATTGSYTDLLNQPPEIDLIAAIPGLNYLALPQKTTAEINALVIPAGMIALVWDKTLGVLKLWNGSVWKITITGN